MVAVQHCLVFHQLTLERRLPVKCGLGICESADGTTGRIGCNGFVRIVRSAFRILPVNEIAAVCTSSSWLCVAHSVIMLDCFCDQINEDVSSLYTEWEIKTLCSVCLIISWPWSQNATEPGQHNLLRFIVLYWVVHYHIFVFFSIFLTVFSSLKREIFLILSLLSKFFNYTIIFWRHEVTSSCQSCR